MDFSKVKKDISLFLRSEEAKVLKKNVAKLGLTASAIAMIMAQQVQEASAQTTHSDSHADSTSHGDHTSHTDGASHTDAHNSHTSHADHTSGTHSEHADGATHADHASGVTLSHTSRAAAYDAVNRRGGHSSTQTWVPSHTNSW